MALYLTLIGLGWLLAAGSAVLLLRENPDRRMRGPRLSETELAVQRTVLRGEHAHCLRRKWHPTPPAFRKLLDCRRRRRHPACTALSRHPLGGAMVATPTFRKATQRPRQFRRSPTERVAGFAVGRWPRLSRLRSIVRCAAGAANRQRGVAPSNVA